MSDAIIWFDKKDNNPNLAANGVPAAVIGRMAQEVNNQKKHLQNLRKNPGDVLRHVELKPDYGVFIRGTTNDIVAALSSDMASGIAHVGVVNDESLQIRYFRHKAGITKTVSYVGIAGGLYWGSVPVADTSDDARRRGTWARVAEGQINQEYRAWKQDQRSGRAGAPAPLLVTAISLKYLIAIIRDRRGVDAWI